jgi:CelD/BcsL family acetyltransferase involved in cellulose biosynthesis
MDAVVADARLAVAAASEPDVAVERSVLDSLAALDAALTSGLEERWREVLAADPLASVYQGPGWCVPWYRLYADAYLPHVVVVSARDRVVGIVPMAVERETGHLVFASDAMADYRDIVARPGYRRAVARELVRAYLDGHFSNPLEVGWLDPASDTPRLLAEVCGEMGLRHADRQQPCYRWFPVAGENLQKKFSRVKTHLNYFKRQGDVTFDVITDREEWRRFLSEFSLQHSLRQLQAARTVSFDDERKRALYDTLFDSPDARLHAVACRVNGRMISGHIGLVWKDVLMLGAPSISVEDEHRSPAVILMTWIMQNAAELGLAGLDLTIGESEFKRRLGNQCVQLTMVEIYGRKSQYYKRTVRTRAVDSARRLVDAVGGRGAWKDRVKPMSEALQYKRRRVRELGARGTIVKALRLAQGQAAEVVLTGSADRLAPAPRLAPGVEVHDNRLEDLLLWKGTSPSTSAAITACASSYGKYRAAGVALHTLVIDGALAAWCYARRADGRTILSDVVATPEFAGGDAAATLIQVVAERSLRGGATDVDVVLLEDERALRLALTGAHFRIKADE